MENKTTSWNVIYNMNSKILNLILIVVMSIVITSCQGGTVKKPTREVIRGGIEESYENEELLEVVEEVETIEKENKVNRALILTYHNFSHNISDGSTVQISEFADQMLYLKENDYSVITLGELFDSLEKGSELPPKPVVITIDDGWLSVMDLALPILKKHNFPATLFIYSDIVGESRRFVDWDDLREMSEDGMDIQCHSKSHGNMRKHLKKENVHELIAIEIGEVQKIIKEKLDTKCQFFSYPFGKFSESFFPILEGYNYRGAVTINMGFVERDYEKYRINRTSIFGEYDLDVFKFIVNLDRKPVFFKRKRLKKVKVGIE